MPDTIDSVNEEAKCTRKTEKLLGACKALETVIAVADFAFASPREPPDKISPGLDTLENVEGEPERS